MSILGRGIGGFSPLFQKKSPHNTSIDGCQSAHKTCMRHHYIVKVKIPPSHAKSPLFFFWDGGIPPYMWIPRIDTAYYNSIKYSIDISS